MLLNCWHAEVLPENEDQENAYTLCVCVVVSDFIHSHHRTDSFYVNVFFASKAKLGKHLGRGAS